MREIFNSPTLEIAREMKRAAIQKYEKSAPEFAKWLEENVEEGLTVFQFPKEHRKEIKNI
jgi:transposase-like protein